MAYGSDPVGLFIISGKIALRWGRAKCEKSSTGVEGSAESERGIHLLWDPGNEAQGVPEGKAEFGVHILFRKPHTD